jgi:predicted nucleic acid-binding protein
MYLLDTNVVSELRRRKPHGAVVAWIETVSDSALRLSALTLGEIQRGVEKLRESDPAKAAEIEDWADQVEQTFAVLPADARVFRLQARWMRSRPENCFEDALIAATAQIHGLTIATRNTKDFEMYGVSLFDPFRYRAGD